MKQTVLVMMMCGVLVATLSGCAGEKAQSMNENLPEPAAELSAGHQVFISNCASCHSNGAKPADPENQVMTSRRLESLETFTQWVRRPETTMMPPFSEEKLPVEDVKELYTYITGLMSED